MAARPFGEFQTYIFKSMLHIQINDHRLFRTDFPRRQSAACPYRGSLPKTADFDSPLMAVF
jgi:hypothetical protein